MITNTLLQPELLAASGNKEKFVSEVYFWLGVIVACAFLLGFTALWLRKKLIDPSDDQPPLGFTLKDLRAMHAAGQLSDEELAQAEEKALARSRSHYLGQSPPTETEEPEDIGHLSTDSEDSTTGGTENPEPPADKNEGSPPAG